MKKDISYFYNILEKSDITLLGYLSKQERLKDEIISKLSYKMIHKIDSSFSYKSFLRDLKLQSILENREDNSKIEYLVLDLNNINSKDLYDKQIQTRYLLEKIREDMFTYSREESFHFGFKYKLLILDTMYNSCNNTCNDIKNFSGGYQPIYMSDVAIVMEEKSMRVIKNRFDDNVIDDNVIIYYDRFGLLKKSFYI